MSKKLGIQPGARTLLQGAPPGFEDSVSPLPEGATVSHIGAEADIILLFAVTRAGLDAGFAEPAMFLAPGGRLWILWPKRSSGAKSDLTQTTVRAFGLARGFVDYKIAAIDAT